VCVCVCVLTSVAQITAIARRLVFFHGDLDTYPGQSRGHFAGYSPCKINSAVKNFPGKISSKTFPEQFHSDIYPANFLRENLSRKDFSFRKIPFKHSPDTCSVRVPQISAERHSSRAACHIKVSSD